MYFGCKLNLYFMKTKFLTLVFALFCALNAGYASFPVQKNEPTTIVTTPTNATPSVQSNDVRTEQVQAADDYTSPAGKGKSQLIALILCAVVGGLGIHRFYLGYTTIGIIQLLTLGGCGIWALIDLIRIITGDLGPKDGSYSETL
jgi:TM2 domain-containing membrane protein YozV